MADDLLHLRVLVVHSSRSAADQLEVILRGGGFRNVETLLDPTRVGDVVSTEHPDLVLIDIRTAEREGFTVISEIGRREDEDARVPVIVVTADSSAERVRYALNYGAVDFLAWPIDEIELILRVRNHLRLRELARRLDGKLHVVAASLETERLESVERLVAAAEARDPELAAHLRRIEVLTSAIARELGWKAAECDQLARAARLHDIGKVAIPDSVLFKPGRLDEEELAVMRTHAAIGADILAGSANPAIQMAEQIARSHHEWWDGSGYPEGRSGEEIPLAARIVAVADAFDAISTDRPYRGAEPVSVALQQLTEGRGSQFDPEVVDALVRARGVGEHPVQGDQPSGIEQQRPGVVRRLSRRIASGDRGRVLSE